MPNIQDDLATIDAEELAPLAEHLAFEVIAACDELEHRILADLSTESDAIVTAEFARLATYAVERAAVLAAQRTGSIPRVLRDRLVAEVAGEREAEAKREAERAEFEPVLAERRGRAQALRPRHADCDA